MRRSIQTPVLALSRIGTEVRRMVDAEREAEARARRSFMIFTLTMSVIIGVILVLMGASTAHALVMPATEAHLTPAGGWVPAGATAALALSACAGLALVRRLLA